MPPRGLLNDDQLLHRASEETLRGRQGVVRKILGIMTGAGSSLLLHLDASNVEDLCSMKPLSEAVAALVRRGVEVRVITRITKRNLAACGELALSAEVRHSDAVVGNFVVSESEYLGGFDIEAPRPRRVTYSVSEGTVELQHALFETLWQQAVPSEERKEEIVRGSGFSRVQVVEDPEEAAELAYDTFRESEGEVLVLLSGPDALKWLASCRFRERLKEPPTQWPSVRVLVPADAEALRSARTSLGRLPSVTLRALDESLKSSVSVAVFDRRKAILFMTRDDEGGDAFETLGGAVCFESDYVAASYAGIFESLWKQSEMYRQLEESDKIQREFIEVAAHELRAPIQAILGYADLAKSGDERDVTINMDRILANTERLRRLVQNLLDVTRIESQTLRLNLEEFDIAEAVESGMASQDVSYASKGVRLVFRRGQGRTIVRADRERIVQVVTNLLDNAVKFSRTKGNVVISIDKERSEERGREAVVRIIDGGEGVPADFVPRLFTKFASRSVRGTGLGLYISKNIIEAHFGRIWYEKGRSGRGSVFAFRLPLSS
jgi:signal transduction histidine kinase